MNEFSFVTRHRVLTYPEYWFELDEYRRGDGSQFLLAHLRFAKFSPSIFKRVKAQWAEFRACTSAPIFAIGEVDDAKWVRFVSHLGFEPAMDVVCLNGERRRMYRNVRLNAAEPNSEHDHH